MRQHSRESTVAKAEAEMSHWANLVVRDEQAD